MIKRRFYKQEHVERNEASDSSSASSDSEVEAEAATEETEFEDNGVSGTNRDDRSGSISSGYKSEDSSANEIDCKLSDDDDETGNTHKSAKGKKDMAEIQSIIGAASNSVSADVASCILKCKSIFKCRLCPRIVCLTGETMKTHLESKRHARSEKLLKEGRLKLMLNSDGELDEEQETHAERHARIIGLAQDNSKRKSKGRQRQRQRLQRKKKSAESSMGNASQPEKKTALKRRKVRA